MLKQQKNKFLEIIKENGFTPELFDAKEEGDIFTIFLRDSNFTFQVRSLGNRNHAFQCEYTLFTPDLAFIRLLKTTFPPSTLTIEDALAKFDKWLKKEVKNFLVEQSTPDFWKQIGFQDSTIDAEEPIINQAMFDKQDVSNFDEDEKEKLRLALAEFRLLIYKNFKPGKEQMNIVDERLNYLSDAMDRLNQFDWKSILVSSTVSISVALSLDTTRGKMLFDLLKQALSNVTYLLQ
ncbi:MAG TPA: hypothetical protein VF604_21450 [Pyrinomonadaceae bacterium]|jgi:hypothetical protein